MTSVGNCFSSDVITFDQNWHLLYSNSARGKDLSNDTQISVIGSVESGIIEYTETEILRNLTERLSAKLPANSRGYSMLKFARLDADAFSKVFELEVTPVEYQSLQQKR